MGTASIGHVALLELAHDGRVPPRLRAEAERMDAEAARLRPRTARVRPRIVRLKPKGFVECMARVLVSARSAKGAGTRADLLRTGFSDAEIALYGDRSVARAGEIWNGERSPLSRVA